MRQRHAANLEVVLQESLRLHAFDRASAVAAILLSEQVRALSMAGGKLLLHLSTMYLYRYALQENSPFQKLPRADLHKRGAQRAASTMMAALECLRQRPDIANPEQLKRYLRLSEVTASGQIC